MLDVLCVVGEKDKAQHRAQHRSMCTSTTSFPYAQDRFNVKMVSMSKVSMSVSPPPPALLTRAPKHTHTHTYSLSNTHTHTPDNGPKRTQKRTQVHTRAHTQARTKAREKRSELCLFPFHSVSLSFLSLHRRQTASQIEGQGQTQQQEDSRRH